MAVAVLRPCKLISLSLCSIWKLLGEGGGRVGEEKEAEIEVLEQTDTSSRPGCRSLMSPGPRIPL